MLFNSAQFLLFFPVVCYLYFILGKRGQKVFLLIASCVFYAAFIPKYLLILFLIIIIDYFAALIMARVADSCRKIVLLVSIIANVGLLGVFKYYNFISDSLNTLLNFIGVDHTIVPLTIILPIGLSFHTFQAMSYTIEVYRRKQEPEKNLLTYALYVMYFPQLVAGPIERPQHLIPQFHAHHRFNYERLISGLRLMAWGFLKKILIADRLAILVDQVFDHPQYYGGPALILAAYFFSFQIYCDFSGYSDIARGCSRVLGIDLMKNFNRPYFAGSMIEFWRRWHISLSTWFRDYLYLPLGGNRTSTMRWSINILIVFCLSGLWHGAQWTFVIWGLLHGVCVLINHVGLMTTIKIRGKDSEPHLFMRPLKIIATFHVVTLLWIFFRVDSLQDCIYIFSHLTDFSRGFQISALGLNFFEILLALFFVGMLLLIESLGGEETLEKRVANSRESIKITLVYLVLALLIFFGKFSNHQFVYFQF